MTAASDVVDQAEGYRSELVGFCYRMLGSAAEADDAAQETLIRAWRGSGTFRGDSALRSWIYSIATNVCIDMGRAPQRRALPADITSPAVMTTGQPELGKPLDPASWITPIDERRLGPPAATPEEITVQRESIRLAFLTALQHLPARQRAVLILRDVLAWSAVEVAELFEVSTDSVTSALARARRTIKARHVDFAEPLNDTNSALLAHYVAAFEEYDVDRLVALLHRDATFTMPPYTFWLRGADDIRRWWNGPGAKVCIGSRALSLVANGQPAAAVYHLTAPGEWTPFALHVLDTAAGRISGICHFLDTDVFSEFGLPEHLPAP